MLNRNAKLGFFVLGCGLLVVVRTLLYDGVQKSPKLFHPPLLLWESLLLFVFVNAIFFSLSILKAMRSTRNGGEQEARGVLEPASRGEITEQGLQRWRVAPYFVSLGILVSSVGIFFWSLWLP
jgi:hypothetical protein